MKIYKKYLRINENVTNELKYIILIYIYIYILYTSMQKKYY